MQQGLQSNRSYLKPLLYLLRPPDGLPKDKFYLFFGGALQNAVIAKH